MHSRIFGIVEKTSKNYEEDRNLILDLTEDEVYDNLNGVADYVSEQSSDDLIDDANWLKEYNNVFDFTSDITFKINKNELEKYFNDKITKLKEIIAQLDSLKDLMKKNFEIQQQLNDKFGFYLITPYGIFTLDKFLEYCYNLPEDTEFEVVKTFDYHW